jgi:VIT1/CCC1 family predicted Fe2+/Mn2+ transporter
MRAVLNIFGVMIFIRLAWVVAHDGLLIAVATVVVATMVTGITTISMSAICTNGEVRGGKFRINLS